MALSKLSWEILNATADDWENLEQIYAQVCFDFSAENYENRDNGTFYWRAKPNAFLLEEIANGIVDLLAAGLLEARMDETRSHAANMNDKSIVWQGWFGMTTAGRKTRDSSAYVALVEQEHA